MNNNNGITAVDSAATHPVTRITCVGTILTTEYARNGRLDLTAFLVKEKNYDDPEGPGMYGIPWGGRPQRTCFYEQAAAELDEELHLPQTDVGKRSIVADLKNADLFQLERVELGSDQCAAVFIAKQAGLAECTGFTRDDFHAARKQCRALGKSACYFETEKMRHVPVRNLLALGNDTAVRDVDGDMLDAPLRGVFSTVLRHAGVRAGLQAMLDAFDAKAPAPLLHPAVAAAPANMNLVASCDNGFRLYVGNLRSSRDDAALTAAGVTRVVNCCVADFSGEPASWAPFSATREYRFVFTDDSSAELAQQDPSAQWPGVLEFLQRARDEGQPTLVHCRMGWNRSVTTAALFMAASGLSPHVSAAVATIRAARPVIPADCPFPIYLGWARAFHEKTATGAAESPEVHALYRLAWAGKFAELLAALSAASPALLSEARAYRSRNRGWPLLHQAVYHGRGDVVKKLVSDFRFDKTARDAEGRTAADVASQSRDARVQLMRPLLK